MWYAPIGAWPFAFFLMFSLAFAALSAVPAISPVAGTPAVDFNRDIRPILSENCFKCHGPDPASRKAGLRLDLRENAIGKGESGQVAVAPGAPDRSELLRRVGSGDPNSVMPPPKAGKRLSDHQVQLLAGWIEGGAPYAQHWAYVKPVRPPTPAVSNPTWPGNDFDRFILARLEREGLSPAPEADRWILARRVALDLTGLPPTLEEAEAFVNDTRPNAYERWVDALLAKPAFGEHWARMWLDLARYADSAGYADDPLRTIWPYRDYVIRAFNANLPFDRFTLEQIAGDLLPEGEITDETRTATAFHRNTMTNSEGGTDDEEFRNAAVVDRVNTTLSVWMGTSMACAQCHTHKYDPRSQEEYFKLFALFNNTEDADRPDESPLLDLTPAAEKAERARLEAELRELETASQQTPTADTSNRLARVKRELGGLKPTTVPVMRELPPGKRRETRIHERGNFRALGARVTPGVPAVFPPLPGDAPADRLALARWLTHPDNPLTARVLANRLHEQIFGIGLVRTSEEFGTQGEPPSYPELLDWLATEWVNQGWDFKRHLKMLVTSATYRQASKVTGALRERDPDNLLLARGPRFRMTAEVIRDQALAVSGLLSSKMYGPPVRPPQPSLGLAAAFGSTLDWKTSEGEDRFRRGLYTEWRRTSPYASLATFDAPSREVCALRRPRSNTPLQALVTLNDPVYFEAAQALARRTAAHPGTVSERVAYTFRLCLTRPPTEPERSRILAFYDSMRRHFEKVPAKAAEVAGLDAAKAARTPPEELAAWTLVANAVMNLDEFLMRP
jgi:mono/diheme cytochrome c family protein